MKELDLHGIRQRLSERRGQIGTEIAAIEEQKTALFQQGMGEGSARLKTILARRIRDLERQAAVWERLLQIVHKQSLLVAHLVYARENADLLNQGLLAGVDWERLLETVGPAATLQAALLQRIEAVLATLSRPAPGARPARPRAAESLLVKHVPDGDGLELADGRRVRYIGIDAPEVSGDQGRPQPFAEEARELNRRLVLGKQVRLERDTSDTDRYGRLLRYVYVGDLFVNAELVRAGLAVALELWPDVQRADELARLEQEAIRKRRGMWAR